MNNIKNIITTTDDFMINKLNNKFPSMDIANVLKSGDGFGEIALISNSKRTATIVCREDCHLLVLSKQIYERLIGDNYTKIHNDKIRFLQ